MSGNPRKKSRKHGDDRISNLPACIISNILSRLPTREAVRTSILSKEWEYNWMSIYNINIVNGLINSEEDKAFANFVDRVLLHAVFVRSFRFDSCQKCDPGRVQSWISAALGRKIDNLEFSYLYDGVVLPRSFTNNSSLKKINIFYACFKVPAYISFPNLTNLKLVKVQIRNESPNNNLKFSLPVLKELELLYCKWLEVRSVEFCAPVLTKFKSASASNRASEVENYSILVVGNKIEVFKCLGYLPDDIVVTSSHVSKAAFKYIGKTDGYETLYAKKGTQVRMLWKGFPRLRTLELTGSIIESIEIQVQREFFRDNFDDDEVEIVPACVLSQLEVVHFIYNEHEQQLLRFHLAKFLLENAKNLKTFNVFHVGNQLMRNDILKTLSGFHKVSTSLSVGVFPLEKHAFFVP